MGICCSIPDNQFDPLAPRRILAEKKYGYYIGTFPWGMRSSALKYIKIAEKEKGRPPYITEVAQVMKRDSYWPMPNPLLMLLLV